MVKSHSETWHGDMCVTGVNLSKSHNATIIKKKQCRALLVETLYAVKKMVELKYSSTYSLSLVHEGKEWGDPQGTLLVGAFHFYTANPQECKWWQT